MAWSALSLIDPAVLVEYVADCLVIVRYTQRHFIVWMYTLIRLCPLIFYFLIVFLLLCLSFSHLLYLLFSLPLSISFHLSFSFSICLSVCLRLSLSLSVCPPPLLLSIRLSVCLCLSICLSVSHMSFRQKEGANHIMSQGQKRKDKDR